MALNKFQFQKFAAWGNTISKWTHINALYGGDLQKAHDGYIKLMEYNDAVATDFLKQFPVKEFDNDKTFTWDLMSSARRNIALVEARDETGTVITYDGSNKTMVGAGVTPFYLVFGTDYFAKGDLIVGSMNEAYPMRIIEEPRKEGSNVVCKVELMGGNTTGIPDQYLQTGERFSVEFDPVPRGLSRKVGDLRFAAPVQMSNDFTQHRLQHKASGDMQAAKVAMGIPLVRDGKVKVVTTWMENVLWEFENQWRHQENNVILYSRSNKNANGEYLNIDKESGEPIPMGSGIYEQVEAGNVQYYTNPSDIIPILEERLGDICYGKISMKDRKFLVSVGSMAYREISRYATKEGSGWKDISVNNPAWATKAGGNGVPNGVRINNYQVNEWITANGIHLVFQIQDYLDDPERNKIEHPNGGLAESYRVDVWHIGNDISQPNIQICRPKTDMSNAPLSIQWGLRDPFTGRMGNPHMSHDEDSAIIHRMGIVGAIVYDPTRCFVLKPNILAGF